MVLASRTVGRARVAKSRAKAGPAPVVALASLRPSHAAATLRWLRDPVVGSNLGLRSTPTLAKTRAFIADAGTSEAICARAILVGGKHVGNVALDQIDRHVGKARLFIYLGEASARCHPHSPGTS